MDRPLLPLASCTQPSLVGGEALGLARLLTRGFPVPPEFCVTTEAYVRAVQALDFPQPNGGRLLCIPPGPNVRGYSPTVAPSFKIDGPDCRAGQTVRCAGA
jgi:hypothetical protein